MNKQSFARATIFLNLSFGRVLLFVKPRVLRGVLIFLCALKASGLAQGSYLGFDRNDYPGDANLKTLRQRFFYSGYWLNNPPGENSNTWIGKRPDLEKAGFGFLVLFNGRLYKQLKHNPAQLAQADAQSAVASAKREGF